MEILAGPSVVTWPERATAGIRTVTPFRGMLAVRDKLMAELYQRLDDSGIRYGPVFLRLHVVDMDGDMDLEVGAITDQPFAGDDRVRPGALPAGRYAALTYVNHARRANGLLIDWVRAEGLPFDVVTGPAGDAFACRYEAYLTDPRTERRKTRWQIELAIRLGDQL
ncbi:GyrI-like domain-containing protein [Actinoplanes subtropicus]|uniref:GyrI-like domain-containing protein n=1 Tax=Actinoplanes subtropicus TaxID=543632 RepID=UPI00068B3353|nr:GyrI-like domain-containing protein [Actinoplanes subtropicus]